jgi:hypothetical protein
MTVLESAGNADFTLRRERRGAGIRKIGESANHSPIGAAFRQLPVTGAAGLPGGHGGAIRHDSLN